jgi:DNA-binding NarL/FixJ family response regulator
LYNLVVEKATHDFAFRERLARKFGYMLPEVFEAERQKAEVAERLKAEAEAERQKAEAERQKAEVAERLKAEAEAERLKTIQKLNKKGWTDMEIAEFMELDLKTIQTYIAATEDA